jgi:uncharacterized protein YodC (DUF2158 family)
MKAGDIVQLKSGGPAMTIESLDNYGEADDPDIRVRCIWMTSEGKKQIDHFAPETLKPYERPVARALSG